MLMSWLYGGGGSVQHNIFKVCELKFKANLGRRAEFSLMISEISVVQATILLKVGVYYKELNDAVLPVGLKGVLHPCQLCDHLCSNTLVTRQYDKRGGDFFFFWKMVFKGFRVRRTCEQNQHGECESRIILWQYLMYLYIILKHNTYFDFVFF